MGGDPPAFRDPALKERQQYLKVRGGSRGVGGGIKGEGEEEKIKNYAIFLS